MLLTKVIIVQQLYYINSVVAGVNAIKLHDDFMINVQSAECVHDVDIED